MSKMYTECKSAYSGQSETKRLSHVRFRIHILRCKEHESSRGTSGLSGRLDDLRSASESPFHVTVVMGPHGRADGQGVAVWKSSLS